MLDEKQRHQGLKKKEYLGEGALFLLRVTNCDYKVIQILKYNCKDVYFRFREAKKMEDGYCRNVNGIHKKRSAVNQVACHKSKQTINESLAENQCVIPFIPLSPLPRKHKTELIFPVRKKIVASEHY